MSTTIDKSVFDEVVKSFQEQVDHYVKMTEQDLITILSLKEELAEYKSKYG